ncbi:MAG: cell division protein FtsZ [Candidatus Nealsonbacteria bacterium CG10_big_fil_rev_8_21_14_0_10_36_24]|uniref:Cell division protein FtsZ n=2 Tax=Candidatus Nealsoniibacteriota TaxID=1817911 RepID=A0A2H0YN37_9BACT|nr:MAG: cell division protein FtsZ [Candidatus Nealsonbacteria bacterium CG10_big_fil_rev_8_21_14_0_10_36_24]PIS39925.1 MAG: cell division protein FtsZ [Candidatus Nealsonbacteria bacterium CG08_land_8_20_14_0_20_36_22]
MASNAKIKVVGIGGSGGNTISRMMKCKIKGVELLAINADAQDLQKARAHKKIRIGRNLTKGLGTGMNPEKGRAAAEEQREEIEKVLRGSDMIFITCGLGGGCGSGGSLVVAEIAKKLGALTLAVVTTPFSFEGSQRMEIARNSQRLLKEKVDTLISISNDRLFSFLEPKTTVLNAFWLCDEILRQAVQGISDLIVLPGIINIDFADVKAIMKDSGTALFGIGRAKGPERAKEAAQRALNSPLLDVSCKGAKGVLFNVSGGRDISLTEVDETAKIITQEVSPEAKIIFGAIQDEKLPKGEIKVTVIATGF